MPGLVNVGAQEPNGEGLAQDDALPAPLTQAPPVRHVLQAFNLQKEKKSLRFSAISY